ncbi:MAG TPA: HAMP domain-containing sensor histidine kinase [Solirubrobacteraceae bacterium]|jgi:signal transduction histidine kinase
MGLRPRLLGALLLTSAVTLAVAALALLSPLEQRLRQDGESTVITALNAAHTEFSEITADPATGRPQAAEVEHAANALRRRSQATVTLLNSQLDVVYAGASTNLNVPDYYGQVRRALRAHRRIQTLAGNDLVVAYPLHIAGQRYVLVLTRRLDYVASAFDVVQKAFIESAIAGLAIALLLGVGLTTTLLRRLERLRDATRELERRGPDANPLPQDGRHDEIGELARAFARMQSRLRRQEAARRAFVATASHELRTPLASLDGTLELLEDDLSAGNLDLEDARARTARAREQSRRLSQLASDLLDLSRLDAEVQLRSEPLELGEICRAVAAEFELAAAERRVAIDIEPAQRPCWVQADPGAVARIVRILLDNALRLAPEGSRIVLVTLASGPWAQIAVSDSGPGIPPAERELIFERFQRGSATGGHSGFGLGLAIGRELASRMGGSLELTSEQPPGACFQLRLPAAVGASFEEHAVL